MHHSSRYLQGSVSKAVIQDEDYIPVALPLVEHIEQCKVIALGHLELLAGGVRFFHALLRSIEDGGYG